MNDPYDNGGVLPMGLSTFLPEMAPHAHNWAKCFCGEDHYICLDCGEEAYLDNPMPTG